MLETLGEIVRGLKVKGGTQMSGDTFRGQWCVDSETGDRLLIEIATGQVLIREKPDGRWELWGK